MDLFSGLDTGSTGYGSSSYDAPSTSYQVSGTSSSYGAPSPSYGSPAPAPSYGAPSSSYGLKTGNDLYYLYPGKEFTSQ